VGPTGQERVVAAVDPAFFGSAPAYLGRTFVSADSTGRDVAVLSHRFWSEALAADPSVIGTPLEVGGTPRIVIGVMAPGIDTPPDVALWIPRRQSQGGDPRTIEAAFRAGDLPALRRAVDDPGTIPHGPMPAGTGGCLEYAIYHSPLAFIRQLLELGADPRPADHAGFPPLIAALSSPTRPDTLAVVALLLEFRADPDQRGLNDYTALHVAVREGNVGAVRLLLEAGADPTARTRIDDLETPLDLARETGNGEIARLLEGAP
jgi:hypothetical protein